MVTSGQQGDLHNFNRAVKSYLTADGLRIFNKPRSIFWELYFFGSDSPLKNLFSTTDIKMDLKCYKSQSSFDNDIFSIDTSNRTIDLNDYFLFGQLLAYCYYFGLQDLHKDNLLISTSGLQVIDVEQAFSELLLPNQTLLLPVNKETTWSGGINTITEIPIQNLPKVKAQKIITGFTQLSDFFILNLDTIKAILDRSLEQFKKQPLRVFFRGTREYAEDLSGKNKISDLFNAEKIQLSRGDIPYFFMFLGEKTIYKYKNENWDIEAIEIPDKFIKYIDFCGKLPMELLDKQKIELKFARGLLYLAKNMKTLNDMDLFWDNYTVIRKNDTIEFNGFNIKIKSKI